MDLNLENTALKNLFKNTWQFLKTTRLKQEKLIDLPWYLLLGPSHSGKSSFIKYGQLNLFTAPKLATDPTDETEFDKRCNWWFCDKGILIDPPGSAQTSLHWPNFLTVAKKYFQAKPLAGIILTLDLANWGGLDKAAQQTLIQELRQNILLLNKHLKNPCPLYLVFTHLDKISGFAEFFADLGQEEQQQPWGFALETATASLFKNQFDKFLTNLQQRIVWRIHQERNREKRARIQHFPWQLEFFKESLANLLYQLTDALNTEALTPLQGIYFVSNLHSTTCIDFIPKTNTKTHQPDVINQERLAPSRNATYFSPKLWQNIIFAKKTLSVRIAPQQSKHRMGIYALAIGSILSTSLIMAYEFNLKTNYINNASLTLSNYQFLSKQLPARNPNLNQVLPALNILQQAVHQIELAKFPWFIQDLRRPISLKNLADKTYHRALIRYFLPSLKTILEPILANTNDPTFLYGALRTYLMLGDPSHLDSNFLKTWLNNYWQLTLKNSPDLQNRLSIHLNTLLSTPIPPLALNQALIARARIILNNTPDYQLAYSIIKNQNGNTIKPLEFTKKKQNQAFREVFTTFSNNDGLTIPSLYSAKQFQTVYCSQIIQACFAATHGDWVLGFGPHTNISGTSYDLIEKVRSQYLLDYTRYWQMLLTNLSMSGWKNWQQAREIIDLLGEKHSILTELLDLVSANTAINQLVNNSANLTATDLQKIQTNLSSQFNMDPKTVKAMQVALNQLKDYLETIAKNKDPKDFFELAKVRFTQQNNKDELQKIMQVSNSFPEPLHTWLNALTSNTWRLILDQAAEYLNHSWQEQVLPFYQSKLQDHYPLFKTSKADITLADFTHFFGPQGIMSQYFTENLNPFIDTKQAQWHYKALDGQSIALSPLLLSQLERALLIRSMFYGKDQDFVVTFSLQPMAFEPGVRSFSINLNGQSVTDQHDTISSPHFFTWPGSSKDQIASLSFINDQNEKFSKTENGVWGFFRLLDQAHPQSQDDTKTFQITFDLNGNATRYELFAANPINPFIPGIIEAFRCPKDIKL